MILRRWVIFFQAEDGIRDLTVTGVQTCALPISPVEADTDGVYFVPPPGHRPDDDDALLERVAAGLPSGLQLELDGRYAAMFSYKMKRSEEHTSELQSQSNLVCRLLLEKKKKNTS